MEVLLSFLNKTESPCTKLELSTDPNRTGKKEKVNIFDDDEQRLGEEIKTYFKEDLFQKKYVCLSFSMQLFVFQTK
jgi:hypothetical protein